MVSQHPQNFLERGIRPVIVDPGRVQHGEAMILPGVVGADPHLHRAVGVDDAFLDGMKKHRAVVDAGAVTVGVGVGVEMQQRQRPVLLGVLPHQRQGDEVIAAEGEHGLVRRQNPGRVRLHLADEGLRLAVVEVKVTVIDDAQMVEDGEIPGPALVFPGQIGGRRADPGRAEAGAGTIGGGEIEGRAGDDHVHFVVAQIAAVAAPEETQRPGVHGLVGSSAHPAVNGTVDVARMFVVFVSH